MKKLLALLLILVLSVGAFVSCSEPEDTATINVGYMAGPTGIGMAKLIHENTVNGSGGYGNFTKFTNSDGAVAALANGSADIVCLPTNDAAKYFNKQDDSLRVLAINCLNSLTLIAKNGVTVNSIDDLNGKNILTCEKGTPHSVLNALLDAYEIDANVSYSVGETAILTPENLAPIIKQAKADIILAPTHLIANADTNGNYSKALDIDSLWNEKFGTPIAMGCVVTTQSFIDEHPQLVSKFMTDYKASVEFMSAGENLDEAAQYVVDATILASAEVAKKALSNLGENVAYIDGSRMKDILVGIYEIFEKSDIGDKLPDDKLYYAK